MFGRQKGNEKKKEETKTLTEQAQKDAQEKEMQKCKNGDDTLGTGKRRQCQTPTPVPDQDLIYRETRSVVCSDAHNAERIAHA